MEFAPPPTPGLVRALLLAIVAHALLLAVLTIGVQWKREAPAVTVEAELWSAIPQEAAPPAPVETPSEPPKPPEPKAEVKPVPVEPPPAPPPPKVDIALEKEKARLLKEKQAQKEKAEQDKLQKEKIAKDKAEKEKQAARDKAEKEKLAKSKAADQAKQKADAAQEQALRKARDDQLKRIQAMAGAAGNGDTNARGIAAQSSGPSASYAGRINARIKPNIVYTETVVGNPRVEIEVRTSPDGTIIGRNITRSSGNKGWDNAALNAIDKTAVLPRDETGRVPSPMLIVLSPQELFGN